jgi:amino acid transporter
MIRGIGLRGAVAVNVITMIGIGPLITIPLVLAQLHGSVALVAWIAGGVIALCDGLAWAELGSLYPGSGGTYVFLREAFGRERWGRLFAFLFSWQIVLSAPLLLASGYIGFAQYAGYLWPAAGSDAHLQGIIGAAVGVLTLVLLYRSIDVVGALGVGLAGVAIATLAAVIAAAATHFSAARAVSADPHIGFFAALGAGLGPALVITLYDYYGYGQACTISDEVRSPVRVLPRSVLLSILLVGLLYIALQVGVLGVVPWSELVPSTPGGTAPAAATYVASTVIERVWGSLPARIVTIAILATAFASTFGNLLGYSRIPYAAATDGLFFRPFATLHARGRFPNVSLLVIGLLALPLCFFTLGDVINALTAGLVVIQNIMQLAAVAALRARGIRAPYRMWLFPLPALLALAGWVYIFCSSGNKAIAFGLLSLGLGIGAFLWRARVATDWPFALKSAAMVLAIVGASFALCPVPAAAATWGHAETVEHDGNPVFEVDGKPFFVYGAAFFYERLPRDRWAASMQALQGLGINTLDLYVPWNWHELSDGDFDFNGRTSPRRDLDEVLRLAKQFDFKILLRPGPVIRNEWRNGGYPAWLLSRPEYGMPLHDLLEGRYPPTATLQNAHSDDAAAQWMQNPTHMKYARRWLERVLLECRPYADRILAVALDDDQGAYIDNQTYPASHFQAYIRWLRDVVHGVTGPAEPVFINTYQMKVTASSPVWAMGNWYQSDAYSIGEHDRAQLEFSTGLLHTRPHQPMMASEFQAGWLEQADDIRPRPADPSNTILAMATMIGMGVRGIVTFPAQDTLYPAGWEVPFSNSFYAWDAALQLDGGSSERAAPTAQVGALVAAFGPELAAARPVYDGAIAYIGGSLRPGNATNEAFAAAADATIVAQTRCRAAGLTCALVDPAAQSVRTLASYGFVAVPANIGDLDPVVASRLAAVQNAGTPVVASGADLRAVLREHGRSPAVEGVAGGAYALAGAKLDGFLSVTNYSDRPLDVRGATVTDGRGGRIALPIFSVPAHDGLVLPIGIRLAQFRPKDGFTPRDVLAMSTCMPLAYWDSDSISPSPLPSPDVSLYWSRVLGERGDGEPQPFVDRTCTTFGTLPGLPMSSAVMFFATRLAAAGASSFHWDPVGPNASQQGIAVRSHLLLIDQPDAAPSPGATLAPPPAPLGNEITVDRADVYRDGSLDAVLDNSEVKIVVAPEAGARAFAFIDDATGTNCFTTVGALRDDVVIEPPLSTSDRIAKYTHDFPAGMFNRPYAVSLSPPSNAPVAVGTATFSYDAPDVVPSGARFSRTLTLLPQERAFTVDESVDFHGPGDTSAQRAVSVTSLSVGESRRPTMETQRVLIPNALPFAAMTTLHVSSGDALGYYDTETHEVATIAWRAGDVEDASILERRFSIVVRLTLARGHTAHTRYGYESATTLEEAERLLAAADTAAQVAPSPPRTP